MALKKLPGGVIVETEAGARLNEEAGVNLEAIHRQLSGATSAAMDVLKTKADIAALNTVRATAQAAQSTALDARATASAASSVAGSAQTAAGNAVDRVTALESAAGFGPSTPEDGQTANFILQPESLSAKAVTTRIVVGEARHTDAWAPSLQAAIDAAGDGSTLTITRPWTLTAPVSVAKPLTIRGAGNGAVKAADSRQNGVEVTASNVVLDALRITGAGGTTSATQRLVNVMGAGANTPVTGFEMRACNLSGSSYSGLWLEYVQDFSIQGGIYADHAYAGVMGMSVRFGLVEGVTVRNIIQPGSLLNSYGIALSRWSNKTLTDAPHSTDVHVRGCTIDGVPKWEGIDTHGGRRLIIQGNTVRRCAVGVAMVPCPDETGQNRYAPQGVHVLDNIIDSGVTDGTAKQGIQLVGCTSDVSTVLDYASGAIARNTIIGHGTQNSSSQSGLHVQTTRGAVVQGNVMVECAPNGVTLAHNNVGVLVDGNVIVDPWADSTAPPSAIYVQSRNQTGSITNNRAVRSSRSATTVLDRGLHISSGLTDGSVSFRYDGNDFSAARLPLIDSPLTQNATWAGGQARRLAFYPNAAPTVQQTGVAKTPEAIHAALVKLGLITA